MKPARAALAAAAIGVAGRALVRRRRAMSVRDAVVLDAATRLGAVAARRFNQYAAAGRPQA